MYKSIYSGSKARPLFCKFWKLQKISKICNGFKLRSLSTMRALSKSAPLFLETIPDGTTNSLGGPIATSQLPCCWPLATIIWSLPTPLGAVASNYGAIAVGRSRQNRQSLSTDLRRLVLLVQAGLVVHPQSCYQCLQFLTQSAAALLAPHFDS